jgi:hypothetical protein
MLIDLVWLFGSTIGALDAAIAERWLSVVVWVGMGMYALGNWFDRRLREDGRVPEED